MDQRGFSHVDLMQCYILAAAVGRVRKRGEDPTEFLNPLIGDTGEEDAGAVRILRDGSLSAHFFAWREIICFFFRCRR